MSGSFRTVLAVAFRGRFQGVSRTFQASRGGSRLSDFIYSGRKADSED